MVEPWQAPMPINATRQNIIDRDEQIADHTGHRIDKSKDKSNKTKHWGSQHSPRRYLDQASIKIGISQAMTIRCIPPVQRDHTGNQNQMQAINNQGNTGQNS